MQCRSAAERDFGRICPPVRTTATIDGRSALVRDTSRAHDPRAPSAEEYRSLAAREDANAEGGAGIRREAGFPTLRELAAWLNRGLIIVNANLDILFANATGHAMTGSEAGSLERWPLLDALPAIRESMLLGHINRARQSGEPQSIDMASPWREDAWLRCDIIPAARSVSIILCDITEAVGFQRFAEGRRAMMEAIGLLGTLGYIRLNPRGRIIEIDGAVEAMVKLPGDRIVGIDVADLAPIGQRVALRQAIDDVLSGRGARRVETEMLTNDGSVLPLFAVIADVRGAYGPDGAIMLVAQRNQPPAA